VPYALPAVCLEISSAEAQLGQVHATGCTCLMRVIVDVDVYGKIIAKDLSD